MKNYNELTLLNKLNFLTGFKIFFIKVETNEHDLINSFNTKTDSFAKCLKIIIKFV